jgi:hypothetical protein
VTPRLGAIGRLLRVSLLPTAVADAWLGLFLGAGRIPLEADALAPLAASLCVYAGGLALNDVADRDEDALTRPGRPLPSGALTPRFAGSLAIALLCAAGRAGVVGYGVVALIAAAYDLFGRGPVRGPVLLALARAGNVLAAAWTSAAMFGAGDALLVAAWPLALAYGAYVAVVSILGHMEDDLARDPGERPRRLLAVAAALLAFGPWAALEIGGPGRQDASTGELLAFLLGAAIAATGAGGLLRLALRKKTFAHGEVVAAMGLCLRRLMVFTAAAACIAGAAHRAPLPGVVTAALILAGYPIAARLRRSFPPS